MDTEVNPASIPFNLSTVLKLNVGGKEFMTSLGTLMSDQNSMLAKMFSSDAVANEGFQQLKTKMVPFSLTAVQNTLA